jgi:hypothetical protein
MRGAARILPRIPEGEHRQYSFSKEEIGKKKKGKNKKVGAQAKSVHDQKSCLMN